MSKGLLLINLGTPDSPAPRDVRRYLAEFLMDPFVVDIPSVFRFLLVYGAVLPTRPRSSGAAYQKIWTERGSPLAFHLEDLSLKVSEQLQRKGIGVYSAMRYGRPSIRSALEACVRDGIRELIVFPLYPQYSLAATQSSIEKVKDEASKTGFTGQLRFVPEFYDSRAWVRAFAEQARPVVAELEADHVLFSFHGLPERQVKKTDLSGRHCLVGPACCAEIVEANRRCYRAQSFATARAIAKELGIHEFGSRAGVSFQSRLGRTPWIRPYTDLVIPDLARKGVKRLVVISPSFVADCLETLEEIAIRARESFLAAGGERLALVPSLNSSEAWVRGVCELMDTAVG